MKRIVFTKLISVKEDNEKFQSEVDELLNSYKDRNLEIDIVFSPSVETKNIGTKPLVTRFNALVIGYRHL